MNIMEKENGERKESREEIIVKLENGRIDIKVNYKV